MTSEASSGVAAEVRTPRAAGVAGIIFSVILIGVLFLIHTSVPKGGGNAHWAMDAGRRDAVRVALALIPFAGISFLWFIGVVRGRLAEREDKLFATVFLGSGLLFVGLLFTGSAFLATLLTLFDRGVSVTADAMITLQVLTTQLLGSFGARMAAVFTLSVTSIGVRTRLVPRWLAGAGLVTAIVLLASPPLTYWVQLAFPSWVLLFSGYVLVVSGRSGAPRRAR